MNIEQERELFEEWYIEFLDISSESIIDIALELMPKSERFRDLLRVKDHAQYHWRAWQARAKVSSWISVEDELPETSESVQVYIFNPHQPKLGKWIDKGSYFNRVWRGVGHCTVTHWRHMPLPPMNGE